MAGWFILSGGGGEVLAGVVDTGGNTRIWYCGGSKNSCALDSVVGDHSLAGEVEGVMGIHILVYYDSVVGVYIVGYIASSSSLWSLHGQRPCNDPNCERRARARCHQYR